MPDVLAAGAGVCRAEAVEVVCREGGTRLGQLFGEDPPIPFQKTGDGSWDLGLEGGHSIRRILYHGDTTGNAMLTAFHTWISREPRIDVQTDTMALDLITRHHNTADPRNVYEPNAGLGAYLFRYSDGTMDTVRAAYTVLATGGCGQIYQYTSNPPIATGDGLAMAIRAGIPLINMEYTQFHPTVLHHRDYGGFLISEAVRGEGAVLRDYDGQKIMTSKVHPQQDLAPRDTVTREILRSMARCAAPCVFLDACHMSSEFWQNRFPAIYSLLKKANLDPSHEWIPVVPAFHFHCGGIPATMDGESPLHNVYAIGEASCTGIHGANRLAGMSLLEGVVCGQRCAEHIARRRKDRVPAPAHKDIPVRDWEPYPGVDKIERTWLEQDWSTLRQIMWNYVGPVRSQRLLQRAIHDLRYLSSRIDDFYHSYAIERSIIELRNAVSVGLSIARSAYMRRESYGCHYRSDFPPPGDSHRSSSTPPHQNGAEAP
ncbi:L-aspartate oxidase-like [Sycon ciliatum]|uniref:L-aspartate oxidase-like n=1 Tax=Sycon ciliatum TaxID=27933 RepID=UPI0031F6168C